LDLPVELGLSEVRLSIGTIKHLFILQVFFASKRFFSYL